MLLLRVARRLRCTTFEGALRYASGIRLDWLAGAAVPSGRRVRQLAALARPVARRREPRDGPSSVVGREVHGRTGAGRTCGGPDPGTRAAAGQRRPWRRWWQGRAAARERLLRQDRDDQRRLEAAAPRLQWLDADHLGQHDLSQHGHGRQYRRARAVGRRSLDPYGHLETADRRHEPHGAEAEHVFPVARHRRPARLGDDRRRRVQGVRFCRQGNLVEEPASRLREVRPQLGLRVLAASAWRCLVRPGHPRDEDRRSARTS